MTVEQLLKILRNKPKHMNVFIQQTNDSYQLSLVETAKVVKASFSEDSGPVLAHDKVLLITDEW